MLARNRGLHHSPTKRKTEMGKTGIRTKDIWGRMGVKMDYSLENQHGTPKKASRKVKGNSRCRGSVLKLFSKPF